MKLRLPDTAAVYGIDETVIPTKFNAETGTEVDLKAHIQDGILHAEISATETPLYMVVFQWDLTANEQISENVKVYGDAWERGYGDLEWCPIDSQRMMPWFFMVSNGSDLNRNYFGRKTDCFGVKVRPGALCSWNFDGTAIRLYMDIRNGADGVLLNGRALHLCDILFESYENISAFESGERFCKAMCSDPIFPKGRVYGFNDWYYAYGQNSAAGILSDAKKLAELTKENREKAYMVIDDGWQPNRCDGPWREGNERFPNMAELAEKITKMGLVPGIWIRPLKQSKPDAEVLEEWRLEKGSMFLDPSNPEVLEYIAEQIRRIVGWGFGLIKYDFVSRDIFDGYGFERPDFMENKRLHLSDRSKTNAEVILQLYQTIRQAAGDAILIGCNTIGHLCAGLVEVNRTGDDTSGKEWERTRKMGINTLAFRMMQHKAFYLADADCVGLTAEVPWELNSRWLRILSESGSPLFISWDRRFCIDGVEAAVKTALKRNSDENDRLVPLDWMETVTPQKWLLNDTVVEYDWEESSRILKENIS